VSSNVPTGPAAIFPEKPYDKWAEVWGTAEELTGVDLLDKAELVGIPFCITAAWFTENQRGIEYVYVEGMKEDGTVFTFNDSSSGVKAQIENILKNRGIDAVPTEDAPYDFRLIIPKGLRKSEYEVKDERQRTKIAKTYYLTTNGQRIATANAAGNAAKKISK
jgi:hypothetical protein